MFAVVLLGAVFTSLTHADTSSTKRVALIFDDGPRPADAEPLLAVLKKENVTATFAFVGNRVNENPATAKAVLAAGHEVVNHSRSHAQPGQIDDTALADEVAIGQQIIASATGTAPRWYWPPYLAIDDRVRTAVSRAGLTIYTPRHIVVSKDYERSVSAEEIYTLATKDVTDGSVILFHEWRTETREQLPRILAELRRQGCEFFTFSGLHVATGGTLPTAPASTPPGLTALPPGGEPLITGNIIGSFVATASEGNSDAYTLTQTDVQGPGFTRAWKIQTTRDLQPAWAVEVRAPLTVAVKKGDTGFLRFFARSLSSADETGSGQVRVVVQKVGPDYDKSLQNTVTMRGTWQEFLFPFTFDDDYKARAIEIAFGFGFKRETVEIGGIELLSYGRRLEPAALPKTRFTYSGREPDAAWRKEALARIEQIRKSSFVIDVRDSTGQPAQGVQIRVEQRRSAFQFGTALQLARLVSDKPEDQIYRAKTLELFNAASPENDLKWPAWDGEWGPTFDRAQSLHALRWLRENGFHTRGHVLVWPGWKNLPASIRQLKDSKKQQAQIPDLVLKHIAEETRATREFIQEWDVLNEPYDNHDLMALFGNDIMVKWFQEAAAGAPGVPLYLNDYSNHDLVADKAHCADFFKVAKFLLAKGAPLGGLGIQGHISAQPTPIENVLDALQVYSELKLPIRITEFDIDTDDEQLQADYTRDFLILAYSHPRVVGVQHWGFWAKTHWRPRSALYRDDWSEKPALKAYRSLVLDQWRTKLQGTVGATGKVAGRGFHGDYLVTIERDGQRTEQSFQLTPDEPKTTLTIKLP